MFWEMSCIGEGGEIRQEAAIKAVHDGNRRIGSRKRAGVRPCSGARGAVCRLRFLVAVWLPDSLPSCAGSNESDENVLQVFFLYIYIIFKPVRRAVLSFHTTLGFPANPGYRHHLCSTLFLAVRACIF